MNNDWSMEKELKELVKNFKKSSFCIYERQVKLVLDFLEKCKEIDSKLFPEFDEKLKSEFVITMMEYLQIVILSQSEAEDKLTIFFIKLDKKEWESNF